MTAAVGQKAKLGRRTSDRLSRVVLYFLLILFGITFTIPFIWLVSTSLKKIGAVFATPIVWIPADPQWRNYAQIFKMLPFDRFILNTAVITILSTLGNLVSSLLIGYSLSRLRWRGREAVFALLMGTMMLPGVVTLVPMFVLFFKVGWIDTYLPLIVPNWFGNSFFIFMIRQFMRALPIELDEAARLDGAGSFQILTTVILPLCKPVMAAVAIFAVLAHYNDFMGPLIYLSTNNKFTIQLGLYMFRGQQVTLWHLIMAASTVSIAPLIVVFFIGQRYFVQGFSFTGLSGR